MDRARCPSGAAERRRPATPEQGGLTTEHGRRQLPQLRHAGVAILAGDHLEAHVIPPRPQDGRQPADGSHPHHPMRSSRRSACRCPRRRGRRPRTPSSGGYRRSWRARGSGAPAAPDRSSRAGIDRRAPPSARRRGSAPDRAQLAPRRCARPARSRCARRALVPRRAPACAARGRRVDAGRGRGGGASDGAASIASI